MSLQSATPVAIDPPLVARTPRTQVADRVLNESLFRGAVARERRRADRSGQPMALLVIDLQAVGDTGSARIWRAVIAAVKLLF